MYLNKPDSLTLLKSSAGGTEFPKLAKELPEKLNKYNINNSNTSLFDGQSLNGRSYMIIDENYNVIESHNREHSGTIEGLGLSLII